MPSSRPPPIWRSPTLKHGWCGRPTTLKPGSISVARTPPASNGVCSATNGWPRPATANGSSRLWNAPLRSIPHWTTPTSRWACTRYYADVAPRAAKFFRLLLALPGGDKKVGLAQMLRARTRGKLLRGEADYQLHIIYLWYERQTARALEILDDLRREYPRNPLFAGEIARIQDEYLHDATASLQSWQTLLASARERRINEPVLAEVRARLAIARLLDTLHETDEAIEHLEAVIALRPKAPFGALGLAHARLGEALRSAGRPRSGFAGVPKRDGDGVLS